MLDTSTNPAIPSPPQQSCRYWLNKHKRYCKNKRYRNLDTCKLHQNKNVFDKPENCVVCYEKLTINDPPLNCGHWVHIDCILMSGKSQCPLCRQSVSINNRQLVQLEHYRKIHHENNTDPNYYPLIYDELTFEENDDGDESEESYYNILTSYIQSVLNRLN